MESYQNENWVYKGSPFLNIGPHVQLKKYKFQKNNPVLRTSANTFAENKEYYENLDAIFVTLEGYRFKIKEYLGYDNIVIEFIDNGYQTTTRMDKIKKGSIAYPYHPNKYNSYIGVGKYDSKGDYERIHSIWYHIFRRTNNIDNLKIYEAYKDVKVDYRWYNYQNFATWMDNYLQSLNPDFRNKYQIDKDILQWGIEPKIYGPDTCCLVPPIINAIMSSNLKNSISSGVIKCTGCTNSFYTEIRIQKERKYLGTYKTPEEAFQVYKEAKERYIRELADYYYSINAIHKEIRDILYRIDIQPDGSEKLYTIL